MQPINATKSNCTNTSFDSISSILDPWIANAPEEIGRVKAGECILKFLERKPRCNLKLSSLEITSLPADIFKILSLATYVYIRTLYIDNNKLSEFPHQISSLNTLQTLHLCNNQIPEIPPEISFLTKLTCLKISDNRITRIPPEIGFLTKLKFLYINRNEINEVPCEIGKLDDLVSLDLSNNQIHSLPTEIGKLGNLHLLTLENNQIHSLPTEILQLPHSCDVSLDNCPLSRAVLERLTEITGVEGYQGPTIFYSEFEERNEEEVPLEQLLAELFSTAMVENTFEEALNEKLEEDPNFKSNLHSWLSRLSWVADYKIGGERKAGLAKKIIDYLDLATKNLEFLDLFKAILFGAAKTCGDRVTLSILQIGVQHAIATFDKSDLKGFSELLLRGVLAIDLLKTAAEQKISQLRLVDEIEVYLGYPIRLKERLNLPIDVENMLYFASSSLTDEDLNTAAGLVEDSLNNEDTAHTFLINHEAWIKALQLNYPEECEAIEEKIGKLMDGGEWELAKAEKSRLSLELTKKALES